MLRPRALREHSKNLFFSFTYTLDKRGVGFFGLALLRPNHPLNRLFKGFSKKILATGEKNV